MNDPLRQGFETMPYRHGAIGLTHPARVGAIARLFGMPAAPPDRCRVLELGCAEGMNLLPLAERFPDAQFVGVDFSPAHIGLANEVRGACGLGNATFSCIDLRDFETPHEAFDYVIAHGVYTWVPDEVKDRLLALCARALAPGGVAYVSYGTLPGWSVLAGLRAYLLTEIDRSGALAEQIARVGEVLGALADGLAGQPGGYSAALREAVDEMRRKPPELLIHDDLEIVNDPCTFTRFVEHAGHHGLHYLGEAHFASMSWDRVPAAKRAVVDRLGLDFLRQQQFLDAMFQRWLRNSLLARSAPATRTPDPAAVDDCAVGLRSRPAAARVNLQPGVAIELPGPQGGGCIVTDAAEKALWAALAEVAPARLPIAALLERTNEFLRQVRLPAVDHPGPLRQFILRLFTNDAVDLVLAGDGSWLRSAGPPVPSPLMRHQASRGWSVANRWHEPVSLTGDGARSLTDPSFPVNQAALRQAGLFA